MLLGFAVVMMLGTLAAMDRTSGPMRHKLAWAATGSGAAVLVMLAIAPPDVWVR